MKKQLLALAASLLLIVSIAGPTGNAFGADRDGLPEWRLIQYFGGEDYADLYWYYQWGIATGVGAGCGFVGLGVGVLNPFAGLFTGLGCEAGLMA